MKHVTSFKIDETIYQKLQELRQQKNLNISNLIRNLLADYLNTERQGG
jgi:predicted DNA-binding ribbon-helix-helix protein